MSKGLVLVLLCSLAPTLGCSPTGVARSQKIRGLQYTRLSDEIYGRKYGTALTMDVIFPVRQNGAAVIFAVSSGFHSRHKVIEHPFFAKNQMGILLDRGYTIFAVVHGSTPKFTVPEYYADIRRSIRFIRYNAKSYGVDPNRIGITGASAGGCLSLMMGVAPQDGDPYARDKVNREPARVQAVACFYPGGDFVNFKGPGLNVLELAAKTGHAEAYKFKDYDPKTKVYTPITDPKRIVELLGEYSPINHAGPGDAPTLIVHGDKDKLVPLFHASNMVDKLKSAGVKAKVVVAKDKGHGWRRMWKDEFKDIADWFDVHLAVKSKE